VTPTQHTVGETDKSVHLPKGTQLSLTHRKNNHTLTKFSKANDKKAC